MSLYRQRTDGCFYAGTELSKSVFAAQLAALAPALAVFKQRSDPPVAALLKLAAQSDDLAAIETLAADIRQHFAHVVVAGSGGSGLSGRILARLRLSVSGPHFHYLENIDPDLMQATLDAITPEQTCFIVISKSGTTVETLSQFYVLLKTVKNPGAHFTIITTPGDNPLRRAAKAHGIRVLDHPVDIGGRFSALTSVGLLPAAIAGLDIRALREGALSVIQEMDASKAETFAPAIGAALQYTAMQAGHIISVMLPYSERLAGFSDWYRQSWAESLGKDGKGTTPAPAVGTTDQHSQLQLYLAGPKDKFFTLILLNRAGTGPAIAAPEDVPHLNGKTLGDVMEAEQQATLATLLGNRCPVRVLELARLGEKELGALLMHFMLEIFFMARLLAVNPFDQPAVEEGKQLARRQLLGVTE